MWPRWTIIWHQPTLPQLDTPFAFFRTDYETCGRCGNAHKRQDKIKRAGRWRPHKCEGVAVNNFEEDAFDNEESSIGTCDPIGLQQEIDQPEQPVAEEQYGDDAHSADARLDSAQDHRQLADDSGEEEDEVEQS